MTSRSTDDRPEGSWLGASESEHRDTLNLNPLPPDIKEIVESERWSQASICLHQAGYHDLGEFIDQAAPALLSLSRIEYSHDELISLAEIVTSNTHGDLHEIVTAFNGDTIIRLIAQADLAIPSSAKQMAGESSRDDNNE